MKTEFIASSSAYLPLIAVIISLGTCPANAINPYLNAVDNKPHTVKFIGKQWGDGRFGDPDTNRESLSFRAKVITTRIAKTSWGGIYKISFEPLKPSTRQIKSDCYAVTDDYIYLINDVDMTVKDLSQSKIPPKYLKDFVRALSEGSLKFADGLWITEINAKQKICTYNSHHNSGHYATLTWKKGKGLVACSSNYGAEADGYSLKSLEPTPNTRN